MEIKNAEKILVQGGYKAEKIANIAQSICMSCSNQQECNKESNKFKIIKQASVKSYLNYIPLMFMFLGTSTNNTGPVKKKHRLINPNQ